MGELTFTKANTRPRMKLYKYFGNIDYAIDAIKNDEIYFSRSDSFNDVFDCKMTNNGEVFDANHKGDVDEVLSFVNRILLGCENFFLKFLSEKRDFEKMEDLYKNQILGGKTIPQDYLKFVYEFSERDEGFEEFLSMLRESYIKKQPLVSITKRVTCFSEVNASLLMWAYYADKHQGICLEYDPVLLNDGVNEHVELLDAIQKVCYSEKQYNNSLFINSLDDINSVFFTKALCWSHEQEWRIVLNEDVEKVKFPCLTGVYFGANFTNRAKYEEVVKSILEKEKKVSIYDAVVDSNEYKLRFETRLNCKEQ